MQEMFSIYQSARSVGADKAMLMRLAREVSHNARLTSLQQLSRAQMSELIGELKKIERQRETELIPAS